MTDPRYTCRKADGTNGQAILDYFKGINPECNDIKSRWHITAEEINQNAHKFPYVAIDRDGDIDMYKSVNKGYTLIEI